MCNLAAGPRASDLPSRVVLAMVAGLGSHALCNCRANRGNVHPQAQFRFVANCRGHVLGVSAQREEREPRAGPREDDSDLCEIAVFPGRGYHYLENHRDDTDPTRWSE